MEYTGELITLYDLNPNLSNLEMKEKATYRSEYEKFFDKLAETYTLKTNSNDLRYVVVPNSLDSNYKTNVYEDGQLMFVADSLGYEISIIDTISGYGNPSQVYYTDGDGVGIDNDASYYKSSGNTYVDFDTETFSYPNYSNLTSNENMAEIMMGVLYSGFNLTLSLYGYEIN